MADTRADKQTTNDERAKRPRCWAQAVVYALAALFSLAHAGCASKQPKQPATMKEFLSRPRPQ